MSEELDELARAAADALVSAMVTDSWEAMRRRFAAMIGQEQRMDAGRAKLAAMSGAARDRAVQEQAQAWTTRLRDALDDDPALAASLRALLADDGMDRPAPEPGSQHARAGRQSQAVNIGGSITGNTGEVYVGVGKVDKRKVNIALAPFVAFGRAAKTLAAAHPVTAVAATAVVVLGSAAVAGSSAHWPSAVFGATTTRASAAARHQAQPPSKMVTLTYSTTAPASGSMLSASVQLIRQRAAHLGVPYTTVAVDGQHIVVTGPKDDEAALRTLAISAVLRFREVLLEAPGGTTTSPAPNASPSPSATSSAETASTQTLVHGDASLVQPDVLKLFNYLVCKPGEQRPTWQTQIGYTTPPDWDNPNAQIVSCGSDGTKYALDVAKVLGEEVTSATATLSATSNQWQVNLQFNHAGTAAFSTLTASLSNRYYPDAASNMDDQVLDEVAIVVDGSVISAPEILSAIPGGQAQITGSYSRAAARELAAQVQSGYLPVSLQILSVSTFTPAGSP